MKIKTLLGWLVILGLSFLPIYFWWQFGPDAQNITNYASFVHALGQIFGLIGMTMFALTFILSSRISWIEDVFGGLDKVYVTHGILGGTALILILAHPIFLVLKFIPENFKLAATYLLPGAYWNVNFGIISLLGMIALIFITLYTKMKYQRWKFTHEFFGLIFFFAALHILLIRGVAISYIFTGYLIYAYVILAIGLFGFSYSLFLKNRLFQNAVYLVQSVIHNENLYEIILKPKNKALTYSAGQFIFVRFYNEHLSKEAHPFSIASKSDGYHIILIVKKLGDFTNELHQIKAGDKVTVEGPYGRFMYQQHPKHDQIWIAGGIGITPFLGMAQDLEKNEKFTNPITLFYAVKNKNELVGENVLKRVAKNRQNFCYVPWLSETQGRLTVDKIIAKCSNIKNTKYFLCGPPQLKNAIINALLKLGVSKKNINEEAFD